MYFKLFGWELWAQTVAGKRLFFSVQSFAGATILEVVGFMIVINRIPRERGS